jgi:hypothetical protein
MFSSTGRPGYWHSPHEMGARLYEQWLHRKLQEHAPNSAFAKEFAERMKGNLPHDERMVGEEKRGGGRRMAEIEVARRHELLKHQQHQSDVATHRSELWKHLSRNGVSAEGVHGVLSGNDDNGRHPGEEAHDVENRLRNIISSHGLSGDDERLMRELHGKVIQSSRGVTSAANHYNALSNEGKWLEQVLGRDEHGMGKNATGYSEAEEQRLFPLLEKALEKAGFLHKIEKAIKELR